MWPADTKTLVIDDFAAMRQKVTMYLNEIGITNVSTATGGLDGWEQIQQAHQNGEPFTLVLSDWNMPELTGLELLKKIRADRDLRSTIFIMITAEGGMDQVLEAAKAGVTEYVAKPLDRNRLEIKLQTVWEKTNN